MLHIACTLYVALFFAVWPQQYQGAISMLPSDSIIARHLFGLVICSQCMHAAAVVKHHIPHQEAGSGLHVAARLLITYLCAG
jgi:hypothetical protein